MGSNIAVIGTGYVGLTTGACFSHLGHNVVCVDIDAAKIERLTRGEIPILEAGLEEIVREGLQSGRLRFVVGAENAVPECEFVYLCVPTPQGADGSADLSYIETAARQIAPHLVPESVVVNKSTVPVGSTRFVEMAMGRSDVFVVSNPEFLREGSAVNDFFHPDRVVIGSDDQSAAIRVASLYLGVPAPLMVTDPASAETIKYASNAFLATKLSYVNAIAALCEAVGADVNDVVLGMGYDKRIGHEFLRPGPGWGGSCFVGDETVLVRRGEDVRLVSFTMLAEEASRIGIDGLEVLAWWPEAPTPTFEPVAAFTERPYADDLVTVITTMGRRLTVTADHPFVVSDGIDADGDSLEVRPAAELTALDWLPVAQELDVPLADPVGSYSVLAALDHLDLTPADVILRLSTELRSQVEARSDELHGSRRRDVLRCGAMRLSEAQELGLAVEGALDPDGDFDHVAASTVTNGTYVPLRIPNTPELWHTIGLFLAEGHIGHDGMRARIAWSLHPEAEEDLVGVVTDFWGRIDVRLSVRTLATARQVSISSRLLAGWFEHVLKTGHDSCTKRIPDQVWSLPRPFKEALLRGVWDGDGAWSKVNRGSSVVFEYGTVSRELADGILRLLGELGIMARLKVGRTAKSTVDTYWLEISGADQVESARFLFPEREQAEIMASLGRLQERIRPTGYRRLSKNAAWVRVDRTVTTPFDGTVYSLEVPGPHTVVATHGLVAHNCFPKDSRALVYIAKEAGYSFDLLEGVITVNEEQFERTARKILDMGAGPTPTIAVWGLTFKAATDDRRDSPSVEVIKRMIAAGATVQAYDPTVKDLLPEVPEVIVAADAYAACEGADVLAVLTEWDEFKWLDLDKVAAAMRSPRVVDARNLLDRSALLRRGFSYQGIGRN